MSLLSIVAGSAILTAGFGRFIYMMEHSKRYTPDAGALHVGIAALAIGVGGLVIIAPALLA